MSDVDVISRFNPERYKSRTAWQRLGYDVKPDCYGKPSAIVERKGCRFKIYTIDQVFAIGTAKAMADDGCVSKLKGQIHSQAALPSGHIEPLTQKPD